MEHGKCWVGLDVLVGVDVLLDRIHMLLICIYLMEDLWIRYGYEV